MKKKNKVVFNYTIDPDLATEFVNLSNSIGINRSKLLSLYIDSWVTKNKNIPMNMKDE